MRYTSEDDRRRLVPLALVQVLTCLIDETPQGANYTRPALREIRSALCRLYRIPDPLERASEIDMMQAEAEADGLPVEG